MKLNLMKFLNQFLIVGCVVAVLAGCKSAHSKFYTLDATAKGDGASQANYGVAVGPVSIPAEVDRPQFVVQVTQTSVSIDEFNRWAGPLKDDISRVVAADLAKLLGTPRVTSVPLANFVPDYRVSIDIQKFVTAPKMVRVDALWVVCKAQGGAKLSGHTVADESAADDSFDALVAAHSRALERISTDIAAAIRTEAEATP